MSDLFAEALGEFHTVETTAAMAPAGAVAVRETMAHRRRVKVTTLSIVGALLIAVPVVAFAANPRGNNPPPDSAESRTPAPTESATTSPTPAASQASAARDARFTKEQLEAAKAAIPAAPNWSGCPRNLGTKLGSDENEVKVALRVVVHTNLDSDSAVETAALVVCSIGHSNVSQIVAYDIDASNSPVLLGTVFAPAKKDEDLVGLRVRPAGGVVAVVTWQEEFGNPSHPDDQEREFAWDGSKFVQAGGPTAFPREVPGNLSVMASGPLNLGPSTGGKRTGTLSVTVKNLASTASPSVRVEFELAQGMRIAGASGNVLVSKPPLDPGKIVVVTVQIEVDDTVTVNQLGVGVYSYIRDTNPSDNQITVAINRA